MKLSHVLPVVFSVGTAVAQTVHEVAVGNGGFNFSPDTVTANVGDFVRFTFDSGPHGVAQAAFDTPCAPLASASGGDDSVFFSGIMFPTSGSNPTFVIEVNSTDPLWFYCPVASHCQAGMVGAINPTADKTVAEFAGAAAKASSNVAPANAAGNVAIPSVSPSSAASGISTSGSGSKTQTVTATTVSTSTTSSAATTTSPASGGGLYGSSPTSTNGASSMVISTGTVVIAALIGAVHLFA